MLNTKTYAEVREEIEALRAVQYYVPQYTVFVDDNWASIGVQIDALVDDWDEDNIDEVYDGGTVIYTATPNVPMTYLSDAQGFQSDALPDPPLDSGRFWLRYDNGAWKWTISDDGVAPDPLEEHVISIDPDTLIATAAEDADYDNFMSGGTYWTEFTVSPA